MEGYEPLVVDEDTAMHWLMPLQFFYERDRVSLPELTFVEGTSIPEPERELLVHGRDMTPTLAKFHGGELGLEVLESESNGNYLLRLVKLQTLDERKPVEFGAIGIRLEAFVDEVREKIVEGLEPLGGILQDFRVPHNSEPRAYFAAKADDLVAEALQETPGAELFGRCNQLSDEDGIVFADIVEILPSNGGTEAVFEA